MSNDAGSNVVPLRAPERASGSQHAQQFEQLLKECRDLICERLAESIASMLDKAGDTLWQWSTSTQDRDTQRLYMEAKDKLLAQRKALEDSFRNRYLTQFDERAGRASGVKPSFSDYADFSPELGLVGEDDLNESLKAKEMAGKLRVYCDEELVALDQRVGVLLGDANLQAESNPFSPQAICEAFKDACRDIEPEVNVRMVFVKLFDDHVLDDVRSIYKAVNALLVQHSILPKIRYGVSRSQGGAAQSAAGIQVGGDTPAVPGGERDIFSMLQSLVGVNSQGAGQAGAGAALQPGAAGEATVQIPGFPPILGMPGAADAMAAQTLLQGAALLSSLTRIQQGDLSLIGGALALPGPGGGEAGSTNVLRELKATSVGTGMGQMDVATLDIMAMLFDQIFDDRKIPDGMKWLIGRLQIPMLKVAILDKAFFSSNTHPARKLLDTLGEMAMALPADFGSSHSLYPRVEAIIQKLVDGFQDESLEIFDSLREELQGLIDEENRRIEEQTRDTTKLIEQKEKLAIAKAVAQDEIKTRVKAAELPRAIRKFLVQQWLKLLLTTYAKRGRDSDAWKSALETMDQLIWSVRPKPSTDERRKLAALLPGLLKRVAAGLQIVGAKEETRTRIFADLMKLHTEVMGGPMGRGIQSVEGADAEATPDTPVQAAMEAPVTVASAAEPAAGSAGASSTATTGSPATAKHAATAGTPATASAANTTAATPVTGKAASASASVETPVTAKVAAATATGETPVTAKAAPATVADGAPVTAKAATVTAKGEAPVTAKPATATAKGEAPVTAKPATATAKGEAPVTAKAAAATATGGTPPTAKPVTATASGGTPAPGKTPAIPTPTGGTPTAAKPATGAAAGATAAPEPPEADDPNADPLSLDFTTVTIKNPFGEGEVEVDEIELPRVPGAPAVAVKDGDDYSRLASSLEPGAWLEFRDKVKKQRHQVKLSYVSPFKSKYLFVNKQGQTVGEYGLHELAAELRSGRAVVMNEVPMFDRAMSSLMSALRT